MAKETKTEYFEIVLIRPVNNPRKNVHLQAEIRIRAYEADGFVWACPGEKINAVRIANDNIKMRVIPPEINN